MASERLADSRMVVTSAPGVLLHLPGPAHAWMMTGMCQHAIHGRTPVTRGTGWRYSPSGGETGAGGVIVVSALESPAIVACLDDVAVMSQSVGQRGGHFGVAEHARPFAEGEIGGQDDGGALIESADEVEEKLAAGLGEGQISEFVQNNEVVPGCSASRPCRPLRVSVSRRLTRSTTLKKRPRAPDLMQLLAMATARGGCLCRCRQPNQTRRFRIRDSVQNF